MRRSGQLVALGGLLSIAAATLAPLPTQTTAAAATPLGCLVCGDYGGVDVILNTLLFVPLGLGLRLAGMPLPGVVLTGAAISLIVESLQLTLIVGRDASLSDLVTNTFGALVGGALGSRLPALLTPTPAAARRLWLAGGLFWLALQLGTALLLQPWLPSEQLRSEWTRVLPGRPRFGGTVKSVRLDTRLRQSRIDLAVELVSGPAVRPWVPVFELRGRHGPVLAVATAGTDLVFQPPARSYALRLRRPAMRLSGALPAKPGQALALTAGARGPLVWARWTSADVPGQRLQALSPSFGWTLLLPFDYAYGRELQLVTALWIVALLAPISYWASRSRSLGVPPAVGLLLLSGLGLIPRLTGYPPVHWSEWLAGVTGIAAGWAGHRAAAYFGERCDFLSTKESS